MEDNIQTILIFLISIILLFIFPVYIAYEKKDDVSYALALKYTQEFVETTSEKGYLTLDEYAEFRSRLATTGNMYDIELEHKYASTIPIVKYYTKDAIGRYEYIASGSPETALTIPYDQSVHTYDITTEKFNTEYIDNVLQDTNIYMMNENDTFSVRIKNTNTTLATLLYNMVSFNNTKTRIYVNCSKTITDTKWYTKDIINYSINESDVANSNLLNPKELLSDNEPIVNIQNYRGNRKYIFYGLGLLMFPQDDFTIECKVYPIKNTRIDHVGTKLTYGPHDSLGFCDYLISGYGSNRKDLLEMYIGVNGVVVHQNLNDYGDEKLTVASYEGLITPNTLIEVVAKKKNISLFIDGERVSTYNVTNKPKLNTWSSIAANYGGPTGEEGETNYQVVGGVNYKVYPTYFKVYKTVE